MCQASNPTMFFLGANFAVKLRGCRLDHMGVNPKRDGTPKWMVYFMKNPMNKWMIWEETPLFLETSIQFKPHIVR